MPGMSVALSTLDWVGRSLPARRVADHLQIDQLASSSHDESPGSSSSLGSCVRAW